MARYLTIELLRSSNQDTALICTQLLRWNLRNMELTGLPCPLLRRSYLRVLLEPLILKVLFLNFHTERGLLLVINLKTKSWPPTLTQNLSLSLMKVSKTQPMASTKLKSSNGL
jgi:hypothetical protein